PIENSTYCFPAIAQTDMFIAEAAKELGTEPVENHPINNLL
ncbi:MAG: tetrahydromethanopterin S-methyltransferase subunit H, partial [Methanobrevibacter wolinii]|nr:tetrahydromethanopterin S-methyltransferase subunit H [Methanobrevibacter wolinii]